ncbi:voltage-gated monoatomic cation channel TMEM109 [Tiliqua scincoides]|uniref:voltage-gated monoatomic cation channel TMEM109 n=1 Tax=Tiliqua scincoides TaxID=71010 RepID=UPI0034635BDA
MQRGWEPDLNVAIETGQRRVPWAGPAAGFLAPLEAGGNGAPPQRACRPRQASSVASPSSSPEKLGMLAKTREMTRWGSASRGCRLPLLRPSLAILLLLAVFHVEITYGQDHRSTSRQRKLVQSDFLSEIAHAVKETLEDLIGQENFRMLDKNLSSLVWIVSSGISSGLHVVARIAGQFLTSFGMNGEHATQFLRLSPNNVQTLLLWGLAALIGYWVLSLLLSLVLAILSRIMWGLHMVIFAACFFFIVSAIPDRSTQALLLLALLTFHALLGRLSGSRHSGARLEAKVHSLERQVEELQRKHRRSPKHLDAE